MKKGPKMTGDIDGIHWVDGHVLYLDSTRWWTLPIPMAERKLVRCLPTECPRFQLIEQPRKGTHHHEGPSAEDPTEPIPGSKKRRIRTEYSEWYHMCSELTPIASAAYSKFLHHLEIGNERNREERAGNLKEGSSNANVDGPKLVDLVGHQALTRSVGNRFSSTLCSTALKRNTASEAVIVEVFGEEFIIPPRSSYFLGEFADVGQFRRGIGKQRFSLCIMDPPWENHSQHRSKVYSSLYHKELMKLSLAKLAHDDHGMLVFLWVTNKPKLLQFILDTFFPSKGVVFLQRWIWVKVGEGANLVPVNDFEHPHRKPYEQLIVGFVPPRCHPAGRQGGVEHRHVPNKSSDADVDASSSNRAAPHRRACAVQLHSSHVAKCTLVHALTAETGSLDYPLTIVSPVTVHSRKPALHALLRRVLARAHIAYEDAGVEFFARHLESGWTAFGNECILFQHKSFFKDS